ncbi:hypothetical protein MHK_001032 [Candidatus Magnetomorum sp. HK-1]|nr:hypothetical protein MHK_001032 [Candidatus Magnetomorum sp. HK-1]
MFKSVEDYILYKGREEGREETLLRLIEAGLLTGNQSMQAAALLGLKNIPTVLNKKDSRSIYVKK